MILWQKGSLDAQRIDIHAIVCGFLPRWNEPHRVGMAAGARVGFVQMNFVVAVFIQKLLRELKIIINTNSNVKEVDKHTQVAASPETPEPTTATFINCVLGKKKAICNQAHY